MAQSNILTREQYITLAEESTFGTEPSSTFPNTPTRCLVEHNLHMDGLAREMHDVMDVRTRRMDAIQPVQGLEIGSKVGSLKWLLKATPSASQLPSGGTAGSLTPRLALRHALGTEYASAGDTVDSAASGSAVTVVDGTKFKKGTWVAVEVTSGVMEAALITNIATHVLTLAPALSATPSNGAVIRNLYNYAPAESHAKSLAMRVAYVGDSAAQYLVTGCYGNVAFDFGADGWGKLGAMTLDLTGTSYTTGAQSYTITTATDEMGAAVVMQPSVYLASGGTITRATTLVCEKASVTYENAWELVRDPAATQTVSACVNTAGRPRGVKVNLTLRFDSAYYTGFDAETRYNFLAMQRIGTGTTASFWILHVPNAKLTAPPKLVEVGARLHAELELYGLQDPDVTLGSSSGTDLDFIYAPLRVAFG